MANYKHSPYLPAFDLLGIEVVVLQSSISTSRFNLMRGPELLLHIELHSSQFNALYMDRKSVPLLAEKTSDLRDWNTLSWSVKDLPERIFNRRLCEVVLASLLMEFD